MGTSANKPVRFAVFLVFAAASALAQSGSGVLRGQVTDPSGAAVTNATVVVTTAAGQAQTTKTNHEGVYEVRSLTPGKYNVTASAKGFTDYQAEFVDVAAGQVQRLDIEFEIAVEKEKVTVDSQSTNVDVNPSDNANSIVLTGKDLEALSDDPDELQSDLEALAGPSAGPNGGQIYIDGFSGGQLPPKSAIREIRINQNPFSAEYDKLGYGRIEVFTKPGSDQYHGQLLVDGNSSAFNSLNPFLKPDPASGLAIPAPSYHSMIYNGSLGGPINKKASFFFDAQRRSINDEAVINAVVLDPNFNPTRFVDATPTLRTRTTLEPRIDYQISPRNTLSVRYQFWRDGESNEGVGQFALASQGYKTIEREHTFQISDTQTFGSNAVNETRFQYIRDANDQLPVSTLPSIDVLGAFTAGGSEEGTIIDRSDSYEFQNYTSIVHGAHLVKFGARLRFTRDINKASTGFNGAFTFSSIAAYEAAQRALAANQPIPASALPSQFSLISGTPRAEASLFDAGLYAQDDWRILPNLTISYGLRFEAQNRIHDHADPAPRISIAWGLGKGRNSSPKTVIRAGFGMFYDRFKNDYVLQAVRLDGVTQQQFLVAAPNTDFYPNLPSIASLTTSGVQASSTIYQIDPNVRAPYIIQSAVTLERQISRNANLAISYLDSRGVHQLLTRNINAPFPGTPAADFTNSAFRPFGNLNNIYRYESTGIFKQKQFIVNGNVRVGSKVSLFGYYTLNYANADTAGASSFLSNPYDLLADYGRSAFDIRNRLFMGGTVALPYAFRLSPFMIVSSGRPYNVTVGRDLNGDSIFNDRPALVSTTRCGAVTPIASTTECTPLGTFNLVPLPGQTIVPINYGTGPGLFTLNMRLSKTFGVGRRLERRGSGDQGGLPGGGRGHDHGRFGQVMGGALGLGSASDRQYSLTLGVVARNVLNRVNFATPVGNLTSPLFAESNAIATGPFSSGAANRRIDFMATFSF